VNWGLCKELTGISHKQQQRLYGVRRRSNELRPSFSDSVKVFSLSFPQFKCSSRESLWFGAKLRQQGRHLTRVMKEGDGKSLQVRSRAKAAGSSPNKSIGRRELESHYG
jgi:hypothetical protein